MTNITQVCGELKEGRTAFFAGIWLSQLQLPDFLTNLSVFISES